MRRIVSLALALGCGCGSSPSTGGDDVPIDASGIDGTGDPCSTDPATCPPDTGNFVSTQTGADTNPGSKTKPFKTIAAGIAHAKSLGGPQSVFVAQGTYPEKVTMQAGISLDGGYECNASACSWSRDLVAFESTIANQDFEGVLAGGTITTSTLLSGFKIVGKDGVPPAAPGSIGITIAGGAPTLRGLRIIGGTVTGGAVAAADRSIGVAMRSTGSNFSLIENSDITGGSAIGLSAAITMESVSGVLSYAKITGNVLRAGNARRSDAIAAFGSGGPTEISNNDIIAGNSTNGASNGIEITSGAVITGNRINIDPNTGTCTTPVQWCAGITTNSATTTITNNVVYGPKGLRSAGVFMTESEIPAGDVILNGNYINGGGSGGNPGGVARNESAAVAVSIGACNNCGLHGFVGRVRNNILDGGINLNRFGVREDPPQTKTTRVELLEANDIWFASLPARVDTLYRQVTVSGVPIDFKSVVTLEMNSPPPASKNKNEDPLVNATWHIAAGSPCVNAGVLTEAPGTDFDGDGRPAAGAVDIGADELP